MLAAEEQVRLGHQSSPAPPASAELTEAELFWLSTWYDEHPEPDTITLDQAHAALASHRANSGGTSASQLLFEAQVTAAIELHTSAGCSLALFHPFTSGFGMVIVACIALIDLHAKSRPDPGELSANTFRFSVFVAH